MSDHEPQRYVAYRAASDEYEVVFYGGPLDGAKIATDIYPDSQIFVHRVSDRSYYYRYAQVSDLEFHATLTSAADLEQLSVKSSYLSTLLRLTKKLLHQFRSFGLKVWSLVSR